jgi:hypothetical protein
MTPSESKKEKVNQIAKSGVGLLNYVEPNAFFIARCLAWMMKHKTLKSSELYSDTFIRQTTDFNSLEEFFIAGDLEALGSVECAEWNTFVTSRTRFRSWNHMKQAALEHQRRIRNLPKWPYES